MKYLNYIDFNLIKMGFDYGYTCPNIDRSIKQFKLDIETHLIDLIDECCPLLEGQQKQLFINNYVNYLYDSFEYNFEDVRKCNEDMRKEAENQIDLINSEFENAQSDVRDKNIIITDLEKQIKELEFELNLIN